MKRRDFISLVAGLAPMLSAKMTLAQQASIPLIGFMSGRSLADSAHLLAALREGLKEEGFTEGQNLTIEYRWADGQYSQLASLAMDLVGQGVTVLVALGGDNSAIAAKAVTTRIPIVAGLGGDPIRAGLTESFSRPTSNVTGFTLLTAQMESKRLGILRDLLPSAKLFGVLVNPNFPPSVQQFEQLQEVASSIKQELFFARASTDDELEQALGRMVERKTDALLVGADPFFDTRRNALITFTEKNRLPTMYQFREFAAAGGLMSYGPSITDSYRQAGKYVGRLLKGTKPSELPILQPTKFEFVINLRTAKALGLLIPPGVISFADEVIE
jgi:ABC-type uncharacterized transport system substrate-binding protein